MSIETWLQEFYPIPANQLEAASDLECAQHCLLKWSGTSPENLNKHNTYYIDFTVIGTSEKPDGSKIEEIALKFGESSCALCQKYFGTSEQDGQDVCTDKKNNICPLNIYLGHRCVDDDPSLYVGGKNDTAQMIQTLTELVNQLADNTILSNTGLRGSLAGTALRGAFQALLNPQTKG